MEIFLNLFMLEELCSLNLFMLEELCSLNLFMLEELCSFNLAEELCSSGTFTMPIISTTPLFCNIFLL